MPLNDGHLGLGLRSKKVAKVVESYGAALLDEIFRERGGAQNLGVVERIACENYVFQCKNLKAVETRLDRDTLFTQAGRKRSAADLAKSISETIARLGSELPPPAARPSQAAIIDAMPESHLRAAEKLLTIETGLMERQRDGVTLTEFERGQFSILNLYPTWNDTLALPRVVRVIVDPRADTAPPIVEAEPVVAPVVETPIVVPTPDDRDAALKITNIERWRALHYSDPEEVQRRNAEATATMFARIGQPSPLL